MTIDGWEQRLADLGQARELRESMVDALVATVGKQMPRGKTWRPDPIVDALLDGPLAPLTEAQAAVERVEALAKEWASEHPRGCCASGTCAFTDGRHIDPSDPILPRELVGLLSDDPPPRREHKTIPCPGDCRCQIGKYESRLHRALDGPT